MYPPFARVKFNFCCQTFHCTINEQCSAKRGLGAIAKSIDPCQPEQSAQADMGRNFLVILKCFECRWIILPHYLLNKNDFSDMKEGDV